MSPPGADKGLCVAGSGFHGGKVARCGGQWSSWGMGPCPFSLPCLQCLFILATMAIFTLAAIAPPPPVHAQVDTEVLQFAIEQTPLLSMLSSSIHWLHCTSVWHKTSSVDPQCSFPINIFRSIFPQFWLHGQCLISLCNMYHTVNCEDNTYLSHCGPFQTILSSTWEFFEPYQPWTHGPGVNSRHLVLLQCLLTELKHSYKHSYKPTIMVSSLLKLTNHIHQ